MPMLRYAVLVVTSLVTGSVWAQQADAPAPVSPAASTPQKAVAPMEEPLPGDHWTYEVRDEIAGTVTSIRQNVVTEVTPKEVTVRYSNVGTSNNDGLNIYDRSWNVLENRPWRFSPHDGSGIQSPLTVGKTWPVKTNNINSANGNVWKRSGTSKVLEQESITTKVGTFDTFKIETIFTAVNVNNPTMKNEVTSVTWYAPAIDHWVKRTFISRADKHLQTNTTLELVDYGRKP
jgi:hypothetical protein